MTSRNTVALFLTCFVILSVSETVTSASSAWLARTVSPAFFNSIINQAGAGCRGKRFYTRRAFLTAANSFPGFMKSVTRREIAAFFAHITRETGHFCFVEEINGPSHTYCQNSKINPCVKGRKYYGRGPIQLTWNYNYGPAGRAIKRNLLRSPGLVASNPVISFKTAIWYWTRRVHPVFKHGFGATIRAINGGECNGGVPSAVRARVKYFKRYCKRLGVRPGPNLRC